MLPILAGDQKPSAVVNIESPEMCHPLTPLVVPKVHTVTPTAGSELFKSGGESDGGAESGASLFLQEGVSGSEGGIDERTNVGKDSIGDGAQILVHHYLAASMYRREMADFLSGEYIKKNKLQEELTREQSIVFLSSVCNQNLILSTREYLFFVYLPGVSIFKKSHPKNSF